MYVFFHRKTKKNVKIISKKKNFISNKSKLTAKFILIKLIQTHSRRRCTITRLSVCHCEDVVWCYEFFVVCYVKLAFGQFVFTAPHRNGTEMQHLPGWFINHFNFRFLLSGFYIESDLCTFIVEFRMHIRFFSCLSNAGGLWRKRWGGKAGMWTLLSYLLHKAVAYAEKYLPHL